MEYVRGKVIREFYSPDTKRRIDVVARNDGTFQFFEQIAYGDEWVPGMVSGIYKTAEDTESAAKIVFSHG